MGAVVGEKVARAIERSPAKRQPLIIVSCSGGARMMEGAVSLMQLAKVSAALARLDEARVPFISLLTDPTTGGVTASYAMLGDLNIAEPGALIGFAGPRVIEQTHPAKAPRRISDGGISARSRLSGCGRPAQGIEALHRAGARLFPRLRMNYDESVRALLALGRELAAPQQARVQKFGLENITMLAEALGNPQRAIPCAHIAGTNGKGSTAAMLESILRAAGLRTGLYTSPHLERINERIRIDGKDISDEDFAAAWTRVQAVDRIVAGRRKACGAPHFFRVRHGDGVRGFRRRANVDFAIYEVGLGGRSRRHEYRAARSSRDHPDRFRP